VEIAGPDGTVRAEAGTRPLAPGELITAVTIPARPPGGWGFHEVSRRPNDRALAAAAVVVGGFTARVGIATATLPPRVVELAEWEGERDFDVLDSIEDAFTRRALRESVRPALFGARERARPDA
jgi:CO/xanthine dehydrogenase FAD-binding subunit